MLYTNMSIESLAGMFSQKSGASQSVGNSVMSTIIGFSTENDGWRWWSYGSMLSGIAGGGNSGSGTGGISSVISGLGGFNTDLELARRVQQNAGIEDPETWI